MENYGRIYLITNLINEKVYVGQTIQDIKDRFLEHVYLAKYKKSRISLIHLSIRKNGKENFNIETICECPDQVSLNTSEKFFIWIYASHLRSYGYNVDLGGTGSGTRSQETKDKIGKNNIGKRKGIFVSQETKEKMRLAASKRKHPPETIEKMKKSQKLRFERERQEKLAAQNPSI